MGHSVRDIAEIRKTIGLSLKDTYSVLTSRCDSGEAERFARLFKEKADEVMVIHTELYNGVKDVLKELEKYRSLFIGKNIPDIYNFILKYDGNAGK